MIYIYLYFKIEIQTFGKITYAYSPNSRIHKKLYKELPHEVPGPVIVSVSGSVVAGQEKHPLVVEKRPALAKRTGGLKIPRGRMRMVPIETIAPETSKAKVATEPETVLKIISNADVQKLQKLSSLQKNQAPPILTPPSPMSPEEAVPMEVPELELTPQENLLSETLSSLASDFSKENDTTTLTSTTTGRKNSRKSQLSVILREDEDILFEDE
jgi:hypothetical protein